MKPLLRGAVSSFQAVGQATVLWVAGSYLGGYGKPQILAESEAEQTVPNSLMNQAEIQRVYNLLSCEE